MKKIPKGFFVFMQTGLMLVGFTCKGFAAETQSQIWLNQMWGAIDPDTALMLEKIGLADSLLTDGLMRLSPEKVLSVVFGVFKTSFSDLLGYFFTVITVLLAVCLFSSLLGEGKTSQVAMNTGTLVAVFVIIAVNGEILVYCRNAIELSKDMMLSLIPVLTGVVAFSGKPQLALSFNSVLFGFAQTVSLAFSGLLPGIAAVGTALGTASSIAPFCDYSGLCKAISKGVSTVAAFLAGIFGAILSVRGVIAGASDTVTMRGLKFIVGSGVPVVGGAISDALGSLISGLQLVKNSVLALGILAIVFVCLPPLIRLAAWSFLLYFISMFAQMLSLSKISELVTAVKSVLTVLCAVTVFNSFVYIIACALLLTIK